MRMGLSTMGPLKKIRVCIVIKRRKRKERGKKNINTFNKELYKEKEKVMGTTRSIEQLIQDFKEAAGEFEKFHNEMNEEERTMFKNWLDEKRKTPGVKA